MKETYYETVILDIEDEIEKYMYEDKGIDSDGERHPFIWLQTRMLEIQNMPIERACNLRVNNYIWDNGLTDTNIWKEGAYWIVRKGRYIHQTYIRRLDNFSYDEWKNLILKLEV